MTQVSGSSAQHGTRLLTVGQCVEASVVRRAVHVDPEQRQLSSNGRAGGHEHGRADCPSEVDGQDSENTRQVHGSAPEFLSKSVSSL